jgi:2,3-bisphosphoglycerate-independent phosphoglycerate mutase
LCPHLSSHGVSENDNGAIDRVAKTWAKIAEETNCSIELVHHSRKTNGNEVTVEDSRGAVALLSAARSARVLNQMTKDEGERAGVEFRRLHFRVTARVIELRLRKLEKTYTDNPYERMSEEQLDAEIEMLLSRVCAGYPSVNAASEAFKVSADPMDRQTAPHLDWYINYVAEERIAGRRQ